jgi:hypothetical protein
MMLSQFRLPMIAACAVLAACASRSAANRSAATSPPPSPESAAAPGWAPYDGTVVLAPATGALSARWTITETDHAADSSVLLLNAGLTLDSVSGPQLVSHSSGAERGLGRHVLRWRKATAANTARPPRTATLYMSGTLQFSEDRINGASAEWLELGLDSFWYPVFADFAHDVVGTLRLVMPSDAARRLRASGILSMRGDTVLLHNPQPLPDFALVAARDMQTTTAGAVAVHHVSASPADVQRYLRSTRDCAEWLNTTYGAHQPLKKADIVLAPRTGPGYARAGYIVISSNELTRRDTMPGAERRAEVARSLFLCHELSHTWATGAVSSGPHNWLNEGFAEFVALRALRHLHGDSVYRAHLSRYAQLSAQQLASVAPAQAAVWRAESVARPNAVVAYRKAPVLLDSLARRIGESRMDFALARWFADGAAHGRPRTTPEFLALLQRVTDRETGEWFTQMLAR